MSWRWRTISLCSGIIGDGGGGPVVEDAARFGSWYDLLHGSGDGVFEPVKIVKRGLGLRLDERDRVRGGTIVLRSVSVDEAPSPHRKL